MTAHDAVYALVLHRFVVARTLRGEQVTPLAAEKIAAVAAALGIRFTNLQQLPAAGGFMAATHGVALLEQRTNALPGRVENTQHI